MTAHGTRMTAILLSAITIGYGVFEAHTLLAGPVLDVTSPRPGTTLHDTMLSVTGTVHNVREVRLNGKTITTDRSGSFAEQLLTPRGYGVLVLEATSRFGRTVEQRIELYGTPPDIPSES